MTPWLVAVLATVCGRDRSVCGSLCGGTAVSSASGLRTEKGGPASNFPPPLLSHGNAGLGLSNYKQQLWECLFPILVLSAPTKEAHSVSLLVQSKSVWEEGRWGPNVSCGLIV